MKIIIALCFLLCSFSLWSFETGEYQGESKRGACYVDLIQLKGIIRINKYECSSHDESVKIGTDETHTFPNGVYDFSEADQEGVMQNYHAVISESSLSLSIKEQSKENPWWEESLEEIGRGRLHFIFRVGSEIIFDVQLSKL